MQGQPVGSEKPPIVIGYWGLRFRAQVIRLLCQQFGVPYVDKIYRNPDEWYDEMKSQKFKQWTFLELPYIIDGDDHVTEMVPCVQYIAKKYGPRDFMGRSLEDEAQVEMFLWTVDAIFRETMRLGCPRLNCEDVEKEKMKVWGMLRERMPLLEKFEKIKNGYYMGYFTICDFFVYELLAYLSLFFECVPSKCVRLKEVANKVATMERIVAYEHSDRVIKCRLPKESWQQYGQPASKHAKRPCE